MFDLENIWQIALGAAIFAIVLIAGIWALRRAGSAVRGKRGSRLAIAETRAVDKNRHLVLVQCDDEEHLLLIGGAQDVVVKTNVGQDFYESENVEPKFAPIQQSSQNQMPATRFPTNTSPDHHHTAPRREPTPAREPELSGSAIPRPAVERS